MMNKKNRLRVSQLGLAAKEKASTQLFWEAAQIRFAAVLSRMKKRASSLIASLTDRLKEGDDIYPRRLSRQTQTDWLNERKGWTKEGCSGTFLAECISKVMVASSLAVHHLRHLAKTLLPRQKSGGDRPSILNERINKYECEAHTNCRLADSVGPPQRGTEGHQWRQW